MSTPASPSSPADLDEYVVLQPSRPRTLPLRTKPTTTTATDQAENDLRFEDGYDCLNTPDSVRSLNSTPIAESHSPTNSAYLDAEPDLVSPLELDLTVLSPSDFVSEPSLPSTAESRQPSEPPTTASYYSFQPIPPARDASYTYSSPSEEGYPGTGVLRPTGNNNFHHPDRNPTMENLPMQPPNIKPTVKSDGHIWLDVMILDRLIDHACEERLRTNMKTPASRDAILRFQMMNRLQDLPPDHPILRENVLDPPPQYRPYQLRWSPDARVNAYRNVLTDGEKIAIRFLLKVHAKHFHTKCLFTQLPTDCQDLKLLANLTTSARMIAHSAQDSCLTGDTVDTILRDNELECSTQLDLLAKTMEMHKVYHDALLGNVFGPRNYPTFTKHSLSVSQQLSAQYHAAQNDDDPLTRHFKRIVVREILSKTLTESPMPEPVPGQAPLTCHSTTTLPSTSFESTPNVSDDRLRQADYQMQLMLLEQQCKRRATGIRYDDRRNPPPHKLLPGDRTPQQRIRHPIPERDQHIQFMQRQCQRSLMLTLAEKEKDPEKRAQYLRNAAKYEDIREPSAESSIDVAR